MFLQEFEEFLRQQEPKLEGFHPNLQKAFWEMLLNGGKRFRPALLLSVVDAYTPTLMKNAFLPALALECLHTYSLIHDDLPSMDNADLRRLHPTLHKSYDEATAILIGDALNTYSFYLLSQARLDPKVKICLIEALAYNGGINGMVLGQALDCYFENQQLSLDKLCFIHLNKTAKLIATSLKMGAIIADLSQKEIQDFYDFGLKLGVYFQIRDDIIDSTLTDQEAGKTTQNDSNKNSYVNLLGLDGARREAQKIKEEILAMLEKFDIRLQEKLLILLSKYFEEK
ncbi:MULTISPECIES: polyprenyl synthetase family protein [unclassified Helicobacter]|uniref:polyprenyl synthetase family protein n=1 Tax=unclassified Helicobacter TaxID=2593540 RepID=UPI000CF0AFC9|nr:MULTISPECIES: polyprenyl synthetase family protein [unclassified Helicobacter]